MTPITRIAVALTVLVVAPALARAQITAPPGYIYDAQILGTETQSCVAAGPGGTFVGLGPGFRANAQAVGFARESGDVRLVVFGFNSISDCAYDPEADVLYITDNAGELAGALTGDTVFAVPAASTASGLAAPALALLPAGGRPFAAGLAVDAAGDVLLSEAGGVGAGSIVRVDPAGPTVTPFAAGLDFAGGLAIEPGSGDVLAAETRASFDAQVRRYDAAGTELPLFAGPSFAFGSFDLAFGTDGRLLATGLFGGDVVAFDAAGTPSTFVSGLTFASGVTVNGFTGRVEILSSFSGTDEERSIHRFVPVERLEAGRGRRTTECALELYGLELVAQGQATTPRNAVCVDGAPCDADGTENDRCLFPLGFCLNVDDPRFPECAPAAPVVAAAVRVVPFSAAADSAARELAAVLPEQDPACVFSDGVVVPVRHTAQGRKAGVARLRTEAVLGSGEKDVDRLRMICEPTGP